jgi:SagB-type dehydrogenase family enzyme
MEAKLKRYRRARTVVAYWREDELVFENYLRRVSMSADPRSISILHFFDAWRTPAECCVSMSDFDRASVAAVVRQLINLGFLLRRGSREAERDARLEKVWRPWLPAAGFLHFSVRDAAYQIDDATLLRELRRREREQPAPPAVKSYPKAHRVALPAPRREGDLPRVLLARRTWRRFAPEAVELGNLATLLGLTWGVQGWCELAAGPPVALKTSPSAGARHPIEVYVLARKVNGLRPGLYHYAADSHQLELLKRGTSRRQIRRYLGQQWWFDSAAAVMLMTACFSRSQWKYEDAGAYRTVLLDAGHLCQTFCLLATWLGLAPFCTQALAESAIEHDLGIDGIAESTLYAAGVGTKPPGTDWAAEPEGCHWIVSQRPAGGGREG